ncbi:MAG: hypothetical protein IT443_11830 [Phycisphaeraceae bacterium]|nr:hypothetical protein [Phycisphaeraceae bacterium]
MIALSIAHDFEKPSGLRPGGIDPRDPNLPTCPGWQDVEGGREIRLVLDGDVSKYRGVPEITILEGEEAIDAAVADFARVDYTMTDTALVTAHLKELGLTIDAVKNSDREETKVGLWDRLMAAFGKALPQKTAEDVDQMAQTLEEKLHTLGVAGVARTERNPPSAARVAGWYGVK